MADAMCGPANPLQQFKQQTNLDRTLQQDRLTSRYSPSQGFRSHTPNAGFLDPEFEAFQAGVEPAFLDQVRPFHHANHMMGGPVQAPSWATDFQSLHISPPPMAQQSHAFSAGPSSSNWAQAFRDQFVPSTARAPMSSSPQAFQQRARFGMTAFQNSFAQPTYAQPSFVLNVQSKGKEPVLDQFDEAAFERAFDQARDDMVVEPLVSDAMMENVAQSIETDQFQDALDFGNDATIHNDIHAEQTHPDGLLEPFQEEQPQQPLQRDEDDALAITAHELLQKVEHNQSEKFKNSQFLGLMRKLRDREMRVEGDKMVETTSATATSPAPDASLNAPSPVYRGPIHVSQQPEGDGAQHAYGEARPADGQDVVNLLNQPGFNEDMGAYSHFPEGPSFEDDDAGARNEFYD